MSIRFCKTKDCKRSSVVNKVSVTNEHLQVMYVDMQFKSLKLKAQICKRSFIFNYRALIIPRQSKIEAYKFVFSCQWPTQTCNNGMGINALEAAK